MKPPKRKSKRYKEILEKGCGGYRIDTLDGYDYDCSHGYEWECDNCPIVIEKHFTDDIEFHKPGGDFGKVIAIFPFGKIEDFIKEE